MSRTITLRKDYYIEGEFLYKKKTITLNPGVTVLVGCNGIGKTTLLHQIKDNLEKVDVPYIEFDNLRDGGNNSLEEASFDNDFAFMATAIQSSEGEIIIMNMGKLASRLGNFVRTGRDRKNDMFNALAKAVCDRAESEKVIPNERWILLDAVDSGLSVDNIVDLKEYLFKTILKHNYGNEIYIIVSANEYEMARGEQCFDVYNGEYVEIKDYEEYRNLILESKKWKNQRDESIQMGH